MIKDKHTFIVILDWMLRLDLDLTETVILAIIYGFSQDGETTFRGSWKYLEYHAKCSRRKVAKSLASLVEKGLIKKNDIYQGGVKFCEYSACTGGAWRAPVVHEMQKVVHEMHWGGAPGAPNNIEDNADIFISANRESETRARENELFEGDLDDIFTMDEAPDPAPKKAPAKRFTPPTLEEVTAYCNERGNTINPQNFLDYYAANGWMVGKNKMKDWRAAVRNWETREKDRKNGTQRHVDPGSPAAYRHRGRGDSYGPSTI